MGLPLRAARIDISAIVRNLRTIEERVAPASVLVDLSADAYGHGAAQVARAVQGAGVRGLVVATVAEAVALRASMGENGLRRGEVLFHEGQPGDRLYIVTHGKIKLGRTSTDGRENQIGRASCRERV